MNALRLLKAGVNLTAVPVLLSTVPAHAGVFSPLLTGPATKPVTNLLGGVSNVVGQTTTTTVSTVIAVVPLPEKTTDTLTKITNPLINTVNSAPGSVTSTVKATGSILDNTTTDGLPYLLAGDVFSAPSGADIEPKWGKIRSFWGKIRSFEGEEVSPFWGKIRSFWGNAGPFEGDTAAFWGNLQTYNTGLATSTNKVSPEWGKIRSFWDELGGTWGGMRPGWDKGDYATTATQLRAMVTRSGTFWGAAVKASTGKDFNKGFADPLLAKYGIDLNDPSSLAKLDANEREHFFLEWYDGLMQFSGADNPDYWMKMVNWTPSLTQTAGEGKDSVIGLLDFTVGDSAAANNLKTYKGASSFDNGHGSAVASLMVAPHDGKGVMGIAPMATVVAYNPFDASETAGWADIKTGILTLGLQNASIINMSLGVPGWTLHPDWNSVLADPAVTLSTKEAVFVIAAGNDGITQTQNIKWTNSASFIVVGSVDPASEISEFSNRPGQACLTTNTGCDRLMNHFLVAPGEMMLVSDGKGGVTRYSGTSFAAPLVSGTVALIHDRWPWLASNPGETVDIILKTATDLGAKGVDPVYGAGLLNVTAALSPISYDSLTWYQMDDKGKAKPMSSAKVKATSAAQLATWEAKGMYFTVFETIGGTYRDFAIPLSSKLVDRKVLSAGTAKEQFQAYLYNQVTDWMKKGFAGSDSRASLNYSATSASMPLRSGAQLAFSMAPRTLKGQGLRQGQSPWQSSIRLASPEGRFALQLGEGDGAIELGNAIGFSRASDYDPAQGGANPLLGMASGGAYGQVTYAFNDALAVSAGFTQQSDNLHRKEMGFQELSGLVGLKDYRTGANTVSVAYRPMMGVELTGAYTRLTEKDAILGIQATALDLIGRDATTDGLTLGASWQAAPTLQFAASATMGRTRSGSTNTLVSTGNGGLRTSAWQVTAAKQHLFDRKDALRLSVAQPLHVDGGSLDVSSMQVIDRQTGALGLVTERFALPGSKRVLVGEFQYGRSLANGQANLALFGKARLRGEATPDQAAGSIAGARFSLRY